MARPAALAALPDVPVAPPRPSAPPPQTPHDLQAAVEGAQAGDKVEFLGEKYRIADRVGLMPLMRFAHAARTGLTTGDLEALAAIYDMLRDCIDPDEWPRFEADATAKKADADDLMPVVQQTVELLTARPTRRPSDSSDGPSTTSPNSTGSSPSPDTPDGQDQIVAVEDQWRKAWG